MRGITKIKRKSLTILLIIMLVLTTVIGSGNITVIAEDRVEIKKSIVQEYDQNQQSELNIDQEEKTEETQDEDELEATSTEEKPIEDKETVDTTQSLNLTEDKELKSSTKPQLIIKFKNPEKTETVIDKANNELEKVHPSKDSEEPDKKLKVNQEHKTLNMADLIVSKDMNITEVKAELEKDPEVEYVQLNYQMESMGLPLEPDIDKQWALKNNGEQEENLYDLNIGDNWDFINTMETVTVGLIDTGIDINHNELTARTENGWDFYNQDDSVFDAGDTEHGTQIAGIISANLDGEGIAGLATKAQIMPLKFMENGNGYTTDAIAAIEYAKSQGITIINCSWGSREYNQALKDVIEGNPDILFICAAGNTGDNSKIYPAAYQLPNIIAVASMNQQGELAATSSYGSHVQIAAPGENIYSISPGNSYSYGSGSSLAAAYVSAAAAIYKGLKPDATAEEIAGALKQSAVEEESLNNIIANGLLSITPLLLSINTGIIENPEEEFAYLPQEVIDLLNTIEKYSELNEEEKNLILFHLDLTEAALQTCEEAGLTLKQSIYIAKIIQNLNLTIEEAKAMGTVFKNAKTAAEQAELLADYLSRFEALSEDKLQIIELIKNGYPARSIVNAYIVSEALGLEISTIIAKDDSAADLSAYSQEEQQLIHTLAINYNIKEEAIVNYMTTEQKTVQEIEELINNKKEELNIYFEDELMELTTEEDAVDLAVDAPFSYRAGINEAVNLSSGSLAYQETIASLPGRNGLDLDLVLTYNSAESYSGDRNNNKWPQKYLGRGWTLNFTRIQYQTEGKFIRLSNGCTYTLIRENETYKLNGYKLNDIAITVEDERVTALTYADGRKETFDYYGNISSITDRFGNTITFTQTTIGENKELTITDSVGQTVRILCNGQLEAKFYNIILPDKSIIALYLDENGALIKKEDQAGRVTDYTYESVTGTYKSVDRYYKNLSTVTNPTGMVCYYEYESTEAGYTTYYRIKNMNKKDGKKIYLNDTYSYSPSYLNATNDYTTTVTNAIGVQTSYTFDNYSHLEKSETVTENSQVRKIVQYEYTDTQLPEKITTQLYGADSSIGKLICQQYTYDEKGNVLTYTTPMAQGYQNTEYEIKYSYDNSYNLVKTIEYKKDPQTTVKQTNDLTSDRKAVKEIRITENNELKKKQTFEYDEYGNIITQKDYTDKDNGILTVSTYENGAWLKTRTTGEATSEYTYDNMGRIITDTDPNGGITAKEYDRLGRNTRVTFPDNSTREYIYNDTENIVIFKNENGNRIRYKFDVFGNIAQITDLTTNKVLSAYQYDELLRKSGITDGNLNITEYTYDYAGRVLTKTVGGSYVETYQYEDGYSLTLSREIKTIEGDKNAPTMQIFQDKDLQNNIVKSGYLNRNLEYATIYEYDYTGKITAELTAKDKEQGCDYTRRYETDYDGNILSETSDKNTVTKYQYDLMGRLVSKTDPNGNAAQYAYNEQSQLIEAEIPLTSNSNTIKKYQYDPKGNMTKQSISSSQPGETIQYRDTYYEYNQRDFLVKVTNLDNEQEYYTEYTYDTAGNLTSQATGNGANVTSYTYNGLNQLIKQTDPMGKSETYSYDLNNNLISRTDRNQNRLTITYNALNQPLKTTVIQPDGKVLSQENSYAVNGAVIKEENENIKTSFYYDNQGRIIKEEDNTGTAQTYTYDLAGNRLDYQLKQNSQSQINLTYTYDKQNRLTEVKENNSLIAAYSYDPNGNCTLIQYNNGIQTDFTYNNANMITQMNNKIGETTLSGYACTYYLDGNQESRTDHQNQLTTYEYDGLGRLKTETEADIDTQYTYDLSGNRIKKYISGTTPVEINYLYDANDRLIWEETETENNILAATEYYYDANGNQISKLYNDLTDQSGAAAGISLEPRTNTLAYEYYEYDGFNRLTSYLTPTTAAQYTYNTKGLRISKTVNGQETRHIWDGSNIVMELNGSDQVIDKYIRGYQLIKSDINGYYLYNTHGDVIQLTDQQGTVTTSYLYDAFGIEQEPQPNDPNPFRYCGEYLDKESGNVYLRARYYDPETGRFISEDPIRDGLNWYVYCYNDPVNYFDPSGNTTEWDRQNVTSQKDLDDLDKLGKAWQDATTDEARVFAHACAESIRNKYRGSNEIGLADGNTITNKTAYGEAGIQLTIGNANIIDVGNIPKLPEGNLLTLNATVSAGLGDASAPLSNNIICSAKGPNVSAGLDISLNKNIKKSKIEAGAIGTMAEVSGTVNVKKVKITGSALFISAGGYVILKPGKFKASYGFGIVGGSISFEW